jgi:hypothetical protein
MHRPAAYTVVTLHANNRWAANKINLIDRVKVRGRPQLSAFSHACITESRNDED